MAKKPVPDELTGLQLEIMQILWDRGEGSVTQVHEELHKRGRKMAYTSAMTLCKRMADRGLLTYVQRDRAYIYSPAAKRRSVIRRLLAGLANRAFSGSHAELALAVLTDASMDEDELKAIEQLLEAKRRELRKGRGK